MDRSNKAAQRQLWSAMHARTEKWEESGHKEDDGRSFFRAKVRCAGG